MNKTTDRPPVLRFLLLFMGLLAVALGLAMLSEYGSPSGNSGAHPERTPAVQGADANGQ